MDRRLVRRQRRYLSRDFRTASGARSASMPFGSEARAASCFRRLPGPRRYRTAGLTAGLRGIVAESGNDRASGRRPPHGTKEFHHVSNEETGTEPSRAQPMAMRASTRKTAAKKKTTRRKTGVRKTGVRKAAAKKTTRRKTTTRKTAARKTGTRKTAARKKAPRRKTAARKAARKTRKTGVRRARKAAAPAPESEEMSSPSEDMA